MITGLLVLLLLGSPAAGVQEKLGPRLARAVASLEGHPLLRKPARVGVVVYDLDRRRLLFAHRPDEPFMPASNMKLVTTAAALELLGPDYTFLTRAWKKGEVVAGTLQGDLLLQGGGDPSWGRLVAGREPAAVASSLAAGLARAGIGAVTGDLVVDASCFDTATVHPDWPADQLHAAYCAPVGGLNLASGCVHLLISGPRLEGAPARVELWPEEAPFRVRNSARVGLQRSGHLHVVRRGEGLITVSGRAHPEPNRFLVTVVDPVDYTARWLRRALARRGVELGGTIRREAFSPPGEKPLWRLATPLTRVLPPLNKESHNMMSEHLFKSLGRDQEDPGSFSAAGRAVTAWLEGLGFATPSLAVRDGSGLSKENRLTPRVLAGVLIRAWREPTRKLFVASLARGGEEGTLADRLQDPRLRNRVRAKSGWVEGASALSGYLEAGESRYVFSILVNYPYRPGFNRHCKEVQDRICTILAGWAGREKDRAGH